MGLILIEKVLAGAGAEPLSATARTCTWVDIQAKRPNSASIDIGTSSVTANKGRELIKPVANVQLVPVTLRARLGNTLDLAKIYIIGTPTDGVNILYEEY